MALPSGFWYVKTCLMENEMGSKSSSAMGPWASHLYTHEPQLPSLSGNAVGQVLPMRCWRTLRPPSGLGKAQDPAPGGSRVSNAGYMMPETLRSLCPPLMVAVQGQSPYFTAEENTIVV